MKRRHVLTAVAASLAAAALPSAADTLPPVDVYKSPTCRCCGAWAEHLQAAGFTVKVVELDDPAAVRKRFGLPEKFGSCHTGVVNGYVLEGHVPAPEVKRLLTLKPKAIGIAVPGMPLGSPGMEYGDRTASYDVFLIHKSGQQTVFSHYPKT